MNQSEIYLATMDVVRRMQVIAEVLRLRRAQGPDPVFDLVLEDMRTFLEGIKVHLGDYVKNNPRLFEKPIPQPIDDECF